MNGTPMGIRQGYLHSAFLFSIAMGVVASAVRQKKEIKAIQMGKEVIQLFLYSDVKRGKLIFCFLCREKPSSFLLCVSVSYESPSLLTQSTSQMTLLIIRCAWGFSIIISKSDANRMFYNLA